MLNTEHKLELDASITLPHDCAEWTDADWKKVRELLQFTGQLTGDVCSFWGVEEDKLATSGVTFHRSKAMNFGYAKGWALEASRSATEMSCLVSELRPRNLLNG